MTGLRDLRPLGSLPPGTRFCQPATGLTGLVLAQGPGATRVRLDRSTAIVIHGQVVARRPEVTEWSRATEVTLA